MKVKFWGTRGSIPTPLSPAAIEDKIRQALHGAAGLDLSSEAAIERYLQRLPVTIRSTVGGNTPCVEVRAGQQVLVLDAGSGLRLLGQELMKTEFGKGQGAVDILISHTHWDHLQGLPFFRPGFIPGNRVTFHSPHDHLKKAFVGQQDFIYFPVPLDYLSGDIQFHHIPAGEWTQIGDCRIYPFRMKHPGESYAYRIEYESASLVYATDSQYNPVDQAARQVYVEFFRNADLLIFDAQYSFSDATEEKQDWGHSTPMIGADLAHRAGVRRLALFHHDPLSDDEAVYSGLKQAEAVLARLGSPCQVMIASEGLEVEL